VGEPHAHDFSTIIKILAKSLVDSNLLRNFAADKITLSHKTQFLARQNERKKQDDDSLPSGSETTFHTEFVNRQVHCVLSPKAFFNLLLQNCPLCDRVI
jgi:hypothetical protein